MSVTTAQLFAALQRSYDLEQGVCHQMGSAAELCAYLSRIHPDDVFDAESVAAYAGRLQAYFGKFLEMRTPLDAEGREFDPAETAAAETAERELAQNFSTAWHNAVFLSTK